MSLHTRFFFIVLLFIANGLLAQQPDDIRRNKLFFNILPVTSDNLNSGQRDKLANLLSEIVTRNGLINAKGAGTIHIKPYFRIISEKQLAPGLQTIYTVNAELTLHVRQADNSLTFSTQTFPVNGSGPSHNEAIEKAIRAARSSSANYHDFFVESEKKINAYYAQNCNLVLQKANQLQKIQEYEKAFNLLISIPAAAPCYNEADQLLTNSFLLYQKNNCEKLFLKAKALIAVKKYEEGMDWLIRIDPASPCAARAHALLAEVALQINIETKERWQLAQAAFVNSQLAGSYRHQLLLEFLRRHYDVALYDY